MNWTTFLVAVGVPGTAILIALLGLAWTRRSQGRLRGELATARAEAVVVRAAR